MTREELIKLLQSWLTTATDDNGNPIHVIMDVDIHEIATEIIKSSLHPAEGAEEILKNRLGEQFGLLTPFGLENLIAAMTEFATLHAQRIAEKMVSERLREELIKFLKWDLGSGYGGMTDEEIIDEYLKSRER